MLIADFELAGSCRTSWHCEQTCSNCSNSRSNIMSIVPNIVTNPKSNIIVEVFILSLIDHRLKVNYHKYHFCCIIIDQLSSTLFSLTMLSVTVTKISIKVIKIIKILSKVIKTLSYVIKRLSKVTKIPSKIIKILSRLQHCGGE